MVVTGDGEEILPSVVRLCEIGVSPSRAFDISKSLYLTIG